MSERRLLFQSTPHIRLHVFGWYDTFFEAARLFATFGDSRPKLSIRFRVGFGEHTSSRHLVFVRTPESCGDFNLLIYAVQHCGEPIPLSLRLFRMRSMANLMARCQQAARAPLRPASRRRLRSQSSNGLLQCVLRAACQLAIGAAQTQTLGNATLPRRGLPQARSAERIP